jgi:membrane fusion protein (multidrug efflux system)
VTDAAPVIRAEQLVKSQAGTLVARDQAKAADGQANGAVLTDQANLDTAKINLATRTSTRPSPAR